MGMILYKQMPFAIADKSYEIRIYYDDTTVNIVAFRNNHPANGFRHQIKISKKIDLKRILQSKVIDELIEACKKDMIEKRWERLVDDNSNPIEN